MAKLTTKKMMKELVNNGYVSKGENLSDAEIRKIYNQMIADEAAVKEIAMVKVICKNKLNVSGDTSETVKEFQNIDEAQSYAKDSAEYKSVLAVKIVNGDEVIDIKKEEETMETIKKLINLANGYDRFTCYIENYKQEKEAEACNERIMKNFIETAATIGIDITESDFSYIIRNTGTVYSSLTVEEAVNNLLKSKGVDLNNKEDDSMKPENNTANVTINPNNEETTMVKETIKHAIDKSKEAKDTLATRILNMDRAERLVYVWDIILHVTKTSDVLYIDKAELAQFLFDNDIISRMPGKNELKRTKRQEFVDILDTAVQNLIDAKVITPVNAVPVSVDDLDIAHDNAPQQIEYTDNMSMDILKKVIIQANTNHNRNFISDWMLTSIVSELIIGVPLKGKDENNNWVEFYKSFTDADKDNIKKIRNEFLKRSGFITVKNEVTHKTTGYIIPAKSLVYGRHTWLGVACVYHYKDKQTGEVTIYHVSRNGVKNVKTGIITPLDDAGYVKLDTVCTFKY